MFLAFCMAEECERGRFFGFGRSLRTIVLVSSIAAWASISIGQGLFSTLRSDFETEFGIPLHGYHDEIEGDPKRVSTLASVLAREGDTRSKAIESIRIESSDSSLVTPEWAKLEKNMKTTFSSTGARLLGFYDEGKVHVSATSDKCTALHEVKHPRIDEIILAHPDFKTRWQALSNDQDGKSLYVGKMWDSLPPARNLGFLTRYSRRNIIEDMTKIAEKVNCGFDLSFTELNGLTKIKAKIELAQEYGAIDSDFLEYLELKEMYASTFMPDGSFKDSPGVQLYLDKSATFLSAHPDSNYLSEIYYWRANLLWERGDTFDVPAAIEEAHAGLEVQFKEGVSYLDSLDLLRRISDSEGDSSQADILGQAIDLYWAREQQGNVHLATIGVTDYLQKHGVLDTPL